MRVRHVLAATVALACAHGAAAQSSQPPINGYLSVHVDTVNRQVDTGLTQAETQITTTASLRTPDRDGSGAEIGLDVRQAHWTGGQRPDRLSIYDAFVGGRFGDETAVRVRAGHMWLNDLGTVGAIAGGLMEVQHGETGEDSSRIRAGVFGGLEPQAYQTGYVQDIRKYGAFAAFEHGYLRRHIVGYTQVRQGTAIERSVLTVTNFVPVGKQVFAYQAAEYEVTGPASGTASRGLSYLLGNVRVSAGRWVELLGTYNRGRSLDARRLTNDVLNGRTLTPQDIEGLRYESGGGRVTVGPAAGVSGYVAYYRDRTNRDEQATGRVTVGGHAANVLRSGVDASLSDARIDRPGGAYHSTALSVGRSIGRAVYASFDYSTSLSLIRFVRSDGIIIGTRPSTRRLSGSGSATLNRHVSLLFSVDETRDDTLRDLRVLVGASYRIR